jgi:hypothetical protein
MGSKSTTVQENRIPRYLEEAGQLAVEEAKKIKEMGYLPYFGPEVAAINPYEQAMAQNVGSMASAYGLAAPAAMDMSGVSTATSGGVSGYTTAPAYFAALERLKETRPDQYEFFANLGRFDPITGAENPDYGKSQSPFGLSMRKLYGGSLLGGGGDDGPNMREFMDERKAESARRASAGSSGDFDPLGPTGNVSIDLSDTPLGKIF